jgi:hypothetical protein
MTNQQRAEIIVAFVERTGVMQLDCGCVVKVKAAVVREALELHGPKTVLEIPALGAKSHPDHPSGVMTFPEDYSR